MSHTFSASNDQQSGFVGHTSTANIVTSLNNICCFEVQAEAIYWSKVWFVMLFKHLLKLLDKLNVTGYNLMCCDTQVKASIPVLPTPGKNIVDGSFCEPTLYCVLMTTGEECVWTKD